MAPHTCQQCKINGLPGVLRRGHLCPFGASCAEVCKVLETTQEKNAYDAYLALKVLPLSMSHTRYAARASAKTQHPSAIQAKPTYKAVLQSRDQRALPFFVDSEMLDEKAKILPSCGLLHFGKERAKERRQLVSKQEAELANGLSGQRQRLLSKHQAQLRAFDARKEKEEAEIEEKAKLEAEEKAHVGLRVEKKFGNRRWYGGVVQERKAGRKKGERSVFMIIYDDGDEEEVFYKELLSIRQSHVVRSKAKENSSSQLKKRAEEKRPRFVDAPGDSQSISPASTRKAPFANVSNQSFTPARLRKVPLPDFLSGYASDECISTAAVDLGQRPQKKMRR